MASLAGRGTSQSIATDWASRVVINGGPAPSLNTVNAVNTFVTALSNNGLLSKIYTMSVVPPDSLMAVATPVIKVLGSDPWGQNAFNAGLLSTTGLAGNGTTSFMNLGFSPADVITAGGDPTTSFGIDVYDAISSNSNVIEVGSEGVSVNTSISLLCQFAGTTYFDCPYFGASGRINFNPTTGQRLVMGNRSAGNAQQIYEYDSVNLLRLSATGSNNLTGQPVGNDVFFAWASNRSGGQLNTNKTLSYVCLRKGFSPAEIAIYAPLVQQLRVNLGGGFA